MKIGICFDTAEDYGLTYRHKDYTDFADYITVTEIKSALTFFGFDVILIGNHQKLNKLILEKKNECDLIFNIAEGFNSRNREALIPALLEINNIKHTASDAYAMSLSLNKYHTKLIAKSLSINTPKDYLIKYNDFNKHFLEKINLNFPIILKPNAEGGSMGVLLSRDGKELGKQVKYLLKKYRQNILCEEYISGFEVTVPVIGNGKKAKCLGISTILSKSKGSDFGFYDNSRKLEEDYFGDTYCTANNNFSSQIKQNLTDFSLKIHRELELFDYSRSDFRVTNNGEVFFLEVNPMPALCRNDAFEICANKKGLKYEDVIFKIVQSALTRYDIHYNLKVNL